MAFCINCGQELAEGAKFCAECGTKVNENSTAQRKIVYDGEIHKCPNCGEVLNSFTSKCSSCGYEIRGASNSAAVQEFAVKLASAESHQEKSAIIRNFPIPNTKEDILEFMILASTNIGDNLERDISAAWQSKTEQAYQKAQIIFQDEKEFSRIQGIYSQVCVILRRQKKIEKVQKAGNKLSELMPVLPNLIIVIGWLISIFVLLPLCKINLDNVGTNGVQLFLMFDFIAGTILIPLTFRCSSHLPELITSLGLILSIVILIPLCGKNLDNVGTNAFQLILIVDIICSVVIFSRMLKNKKHNERVSKRQNDKVSQEKEDDLCEVKVPSAVANGSAENYAVVESLFAEAGFTNVKTIPLNDLTLGIRKKVGAVDKITINGKEVSSYFRKKFAPDAPVLIMYHSLRY